MERLTELKELQNVRKFITLNSVSKDVLHKMFNDVFDKLAVYEKAEAEGRLHIVPCKKGTTVYIPYRYYDDERWHAGIKRLFYLCCYEHQYGELGKDWFLTKEEAMQALERME